MAPLKKTIYLGRFISAPHAGPDSALEIREGAVLVGPSLGPSSGSGPGTGQSTGNHDDGSRRARVEEGRIEKVDWTVSSADPGEARRSFGFGVGAGGDEGEGEEEGEVEVVSCGKGGFFFPGFVGESFFPSVFFPCLLNMFGEMMIGDVVGCLVLAVRFLGDR